MFAVLLQHTIEPFAYYESAFNATRYSGLIHAQQELLLLQKIFLKSLFLTETQRRRKCKKVWNSQVELC